MAKLSLYWMTPEAKQKWGECGARGSEGCGLFSPGHLFDVPADANAAQKAFMVGINEAAQKLMAPLLLDFDKEASKPGNENLRMVVVSNDDGRRLTYAHCSSAAER